MLFRQIWISLPVLFFGVQSLALSVSCSYMVLSSLPSGPEAIQSVLDVKVGPQDSRIQTSAGDVLITLETDGDGIESSNLLGFIEVRDGEGIMIYAALRKTDEPAVLSARNKRHEVGLSCSLNP